MMVGFVVDRFMGKRMVGDVEECDECGRWRGITLKLIVDADISGGVVFFFCITLLLVFLAYQICLLLLLPLIIHSSYIFVSNSLPLRLFPSLEIHFLI
jgi:hypothetical protein